MEGPPHPAEAPPRNASLSTAALLLDLPFPEDILRVIISFLGDPLDALHLGRASKSLATFLDKQASFWEWLWKASEYDVRPSSPLLKSCENDRSRLAAVHRAQAALEKGDLVPVLLHEEPMADYYYSNYSATHAIDIAAAVQVQTIAYGSFESEQPKKLTITDFSNWPDCKSSSGSELPHETEINLIGPACATHFRQFYSAASVQRTYFIDTKTHAQIPVDMRPPGNFNCNWMGHTANGHGAYPHLLVRGNAGGKISNMWIFDVSKRQWLTRDPCIFPDHLSSKVQFFGPWILFFEHKTLFVSIYEVTTSGDVVNVMSLFPLKSILPEMKRSWFGDCIDIIITLNHLLVWFKPMNDEGYPEGLGTDRLLAFPLQKRQLSLEHAITLKVPQFDTTTITAACGLVLIASAQYVAVVSLLRRKVLSIIHFADAIKRCIVLDSTMFLVVSEKKSIAFDMLKRNCIAQPDSYFPPNGSITFFTVAEGSDKPVIQHTCSSPTAFSTELRKLFCKSTSLTELPVEWFPGPDNIKNSQIAVIRRRVGKYKLRKTSSWVTRTEFFPIAADAFELISDMTKNMWARMLAPSELAEYREEQKGLPQMPNLVPTHSRSRHAPGANAFKHSVALSSPSQENQQQEVRVLFLLLSVEKRIKLTPRPWTEAEATAARAALGITN